MAILEMLEQIDFGDIDGLFDPHLARYFLDFGFWKRIVDDKTFFVIGRKGTGKSAIYSWIKDKAEGSERIVENLPFNNFPFEKILSLDDSSYSIPNQYQSIWRNILLTEIARIITTDEKSDANSDYEQLKNYCDFFYGNDLTDIHALTIANTRRTSEGLEKIFSTKVENEVERQLVRDYSNVTNANRKLEKIVLDYLKLSKNDKYVVQIDQLDDTYNQYSDKDKFHQLLISLFKATYNLNQTLRKQGLKTKIIIYLRSDIYNEMHRLDSESARWDQYIFKLQWAIISKADWANPKLMRVIEERITTSVDCRGIYHPFSYFFPSYVLKDHHPESDLFKYTINRTFHRPRDVIQFAIKLQEKVLQQSCFKLQTLRDAEREYSLWLISEVENEVGARIKDFNVLYDLLREIGPLPIWFAAFEEIYKKYQDILLFSAEEMIDILYSYAIIMNIDTNYDPPRHFSIIRNERSRFTSSTKMMIHKGYWRGVSAIEYSPSCR